MPTAAIEVRFVNEPQGSQKTGSIKGAHGEVFSVWPEALPDFQVGKVYDIEFNEREFKGKTYRTVKRIMPRGSARKAPVANQNQAPSWEEIGDEIPEWGSGDNAGILDVPVKAIKSIGQLVRNQDQDMADLFAIEVVSGLLQGMLTNGAPLPRLLDRESIKGWIKQSREIWQEAAAEK